MNLNVIKLDQNWKLKFDNKVLNASVPGDITIDLFNAGLIKDPYVAENYKDAEWVGRNDYVYENQLIVTKEMLEYDVIDLTFKGIDLFADIYLNDNLIGSTKNAFLGYTYNVKQYLKEGVNELRVLMHSTLNTMDKIDTKDYFAIFNIPRIFVRKPQCHFGWDWAPKICAFGIIDDVYLELKNKYQIEDVRVIADAEGNVRFHALLNYDNKHLYGPDDTIIVRGEEVKDDKLVYYISKTPNGDEYEKYEAPMIGHKNFAGFNVKDCKLWWPVGYGDPNLYNYKVELYRDGKLQDVKSGKFGFRTVEVKETPIEHNKIGMNFYINGVKVFLKGSNWVPPECFTGVMKDEKYRELVKLAKEMNANILRVWGGGAYEKDIFFDICDEEGILVWQDFALACADIPEEEPDFLNNFLEEVRYQIKRLRNHPSLIYWCGGNEKTGTYGNCITHGDTLVNVTMYGIVMDMDGTRPYRRQSPHSYTDIGNDPSSGDSHFNCFESCLTKGLSTYRDSLSQKVVPFASECAVLGPSSEETLRKIFPEDKIWPMNEMWVDRFMENPYSALQGMNFPVRERVYAEQLFDKIDGFKDFIQKAMIAQAESLKAESEFSRAHTDKTGAFLNWMFDDIWPSGTWATVDYYLEPKEAYYQLRRSFEPNLGSFYDDNKGKTHFFFDVQAKEAFDSTVLVSAKTFDGKELFNKEFAVKASNAKPFDVELDVANNKECYFVATYSIGDTKKKTFYSSKMYAHEKFDADFSYEVEKVSANNILVKIHAESFVKSLFIHFKDNYKYKYSDNYINMEKGDDVVINITSKDNIDINGIMFEPFRG
ncbi:MAG: hypothetical protein MJ248_01900 [Bacilli bacterium]|nr:hypothetical protein [Bacilli bacterium]